MKDRKTESKRERGLQLSYDTGIKSHILNTYIRQSCDVHVLHDTGRMEINCYNSIRVYHMVLYTTSPSEST